MDVLRGRTRTASHSRTSAHRHVLFPGLTRWHPAAPGCTDPRTIDRDGGAMRPAPDSTTQQRSSRAAKGACLEGRRSLALNSRSNRPRSGAPRSGASRRANAPAIPGRLARSKNKRRSARADWIPPGRGRLQLRFRTGLSGERYVKTRGWRRATLARCPNHPHGDCPLARHGTYARKTPPGTRIARWHCPESHTTFSLLPDCLAARLPGTLAELEARVGVTRGTTSRFAAVRFRGPCSTEAVGPVHERWAPDEEPPANAALSTR